MFVVEEVRQSIAVGGKMPFQKQVGIVEDMTVEPVNNGD